MNNHLSHNDYPAHRQLTLPILHMLEQPRYDQDQDQDPELDYEQGVITGAELEKMQQEYVSAPETTQSVDPAVLAGRSVISRSQRNRSGVRTNADGSRDRRFGRRSSLGHDKSPSSEQNLN